MGEQKNNIEKDFILFKKVGTIDKYNFFEYMAVLLDGGISITNALESVGSKIKSSYFRQKVSEMQTFISSGDSFSKSMKKIPDVFSVSEISVIEAGEASGKLSLSLLKISDDLKKSYDLKNKIKGALTYPMIIFIFLFLAIIIVMTYVIPSMKALFEDVGTNLPMSTKALIYTSDFVLGNLALIFLMFISIVTFILIYINTESGRMALEKFIISFPLLGKVYRNYILANGASTLGSLVGSGISVIKSLQLAGKSTGSLIYENLFDDVSDKVASGQKISTSMEEVDEYGEFFPKDYLQMLTVGETSASLEEVSQKLTNQYDKEVDYSLANMVRWIEPIALLLSGIFVMWFVFAIFGAIMEITQSVG